MGNNIPQWEPNPTQYDFLRVIPSFLSAGGL